MLLYNCKDCKKKKFFSQNRKTIYGQDNMIRIQGSYATGAAMRAAPAARGPIDSKGRYIMFGDYEKPKREKARDCLLLFLPALPAQPVLEVFG